MSASGQIRDTWPSC